MAAAAILYFQICEISLVDIVWKAQTYHRGQNRPFRCGHIAIFQIFVWGTFGLPAVRTWGCL